MIERDATNEIIKNQPFWIVREVLRLWDLGYDTRAITHVLRSSESEIERWLHVGLDERWARKKD